MLIHLCVDGHMFGLLYVHILLVLVNCYMLALEDLHTSLLADVHVGGHVCARVKYFC